MSHTDTLRLGSRGVAVAALQAALNRDGAGLPEHGNFDAATERAVRAFQRAAGLAADGVAGPRTLAALERPDRLCADVLAAAVGISAAAAAEWVAPINEAIRRFSLASTLNRLAMFLAQVGHESGGFSRLAENLNYSAQGLAAVWPNRFGEKDAAGRYIHLPSGRRKPNAQAEAIARRPEQIANQVYANRMGNGPAASGDGWKYRGRGLIQLTGKDLYIACGRAIGLDLAFQPHLLERPQWAALSAGWYWSERGLSVPADAGDVVRVTRMVNGGEHGLADRQARFERARKALSGVLS